MKLEINRADFGVVRTDVDYKELLAASSNIDDAKLAAKCINLEYHVILRQILKCCMARLHHRHLAHHKQDHVG